MLPFSWKLIWRNTTHLRVNFLTWTVALGKILTLDNMRKWDIIVINWYCIRKKNKIVEQFHLHCKVASAVCNTVFDIFGIDYLMLARVLDLLACWNEQFGSHQCTLLWRMIPPFLAYCGVSWWERNEHNFEEWKVNVGAFHYSLIPFFIGQWSKTMYFFLFFFSRSFCPLPFSSFVDLLYTSRIMGVIIPFRPLNKILIYS